MHLFFGMMIYFWLSFSKVYQTFYILKSNSVLLVHVHSTVKVLNCDTVSAHIVCCAMWILGSVFDKLDFKKKIYIILHFVTPPLSLLAME